MFTLTVNLPNRPEGDLVWIPGLGQYKNGGMYALDILDEDKIYGAELPKGTVPTPAQAEGAPVGVIDAGALTQTQTTQAPVKSIQEPASHASNSEEDS